MTHQADSNVIETVQLLCENGLSHMADAMRLMLNEAMRIEQSFVVANHASNAPSLPRYLVYRHFLKWVNALDKQATAAGITDPDKFSQPFANAKLASSDVDFLRREAKALDEDLRKQDAKAKAVVTAFREQAKNAAQASQTPPPTPPEIQQLQAERTHRAAYDQCARTSRPGKKARLDAYLNREFAPHISLKTLTRPPMALSAGSKSQTSTLAQE